ncbi:MAG: Fe-S cluster assembly ATPase SufC [bacterium]|nr:Fe-S cluster assembly ATPase SufC [bacterium]
MSVLRIENLTVSIESKIILKDFNLEVKSGEVHVLMGHNGVGKSTLTKVVMGDPNYKIESGNIYYDNILINNLSPDERSRLGIFLGMQLPLEIEGVTNADFLRSAISTKEKENFKLYDFIKELDNYVDMLNMDPNMIHRGINQGFSGGERKKNEILQMYMLKPSLVLLDEIDSGLDVDSLKIVGQAINKYLKEYNPGIILVTHYLKLLDYIKPHFVHVVSEGNIKKTGNYSLAKKIEKEGFKIINEKNVISIGECAIKEKIKNE